MIQRPIRAEQGSGWARRPDDHATLRAILVGALLCAVLAMAAPINWNILGGGSITLDHTAVGATALFFGLVLLGNGAARLLDAKFGRKALLVGCVLAAGGALLLAAALPALPEARPGGGIGPALVRVAWVLGVAVWVLLAILVVTRLGEAIVTGGGWLSLNRAELLTVFAMLLIGSTVVTMGLVMQLIPTLPAVEYYGDPRNNRWPQLLWPHIPHWASVTDRAAVFGFYEGLWELPWYREPQPDRFGWPALQAVYETVHVIRQIPWGAWFVPLLAWGAFLVPLYAFMICWMVIMRRQWMDREILAYPLARLPEEVAQADEPPHASVSGHIWRDPWMWVGFGLPVALTSLRALGNYWPGFPDVVTQWETDIIGGQAKLYVYFSFITIGFTYLINTRISLSVWSLTMAGVLVSGWMSLRGLESPEFLSDYGTVGKPFMYHLGMGALLALAAYTVFSARRHLACVLRKALLGDPRVDDSDEILGYRPAVLICVGSAVVMVAWLIALGMQWWVAVTFWLIMMLIFHGVTRIVVEAGLGTCVAPGIAPVFTVSKLGAFALSPGSIVALGLQYPYCADIRTFAMVAAAHGLKITHHVRRHRHRIFWAMLLGLAVALAVSAVTTIYLAYVYQGTGLSDWFFHQAPQLGPAYAATVLEGRPEANVRGWGYSIAGALLMVVLMTCNRRFLNWPIHPIGLAVMGIHLMARLWLSVFIAWLVKTLVLKYGGPKAYTRTVPFFLGLILGQCAVVALWLLIDAATDHRGNYTFWI